MSRIVLIHGFANGLETLLHPAPEMGELFAFQDQISTKEAALFKWFNLYKFDLKDSFSINSHKIIYQEEKKKARSKETLLSLHKFLMQHEPEVIVAFSMGCYLFSNYINKYSLPDCIKKISFIQADLAIDFKIKDHEVNKKLRNKYLIWQNYWCFWDPTLSISSVLNKKKRLGLGKAINPLIENKFYPLYKNPNLHISSAGDPEIVKEILKIKTIPSATI